MLDPEGSKIKRAKNRESSAELLRARGISFEEKNAGAHLVVMGRWDFWPGTGLWIRRGQTKQRRGVFGLLRAIEAETTKAPL